MIRNRSITIGVWVYEEPWGLQRTLDSLQLFTSQHKYNLVLLPDGPDNATSDALKRLDHIPQLATKQPHGAAACFNRIVRHDRSDVVVFLESGVTVTSGWLDKLLAALDSDPANGIAVPSTNRSWNEQRVSSSKSNDIAEIIRTGASISVRFGKKCQILEPLYSIADFCHIVTRDVINTIGAADEGYGLGPCWEMDYNIRAKRVGFNGVWACGAYVHRAQFTPRRAKMEAELGEFSKRLYQDKFCALKVKFGRDGYEPHCRGDECEHFAPADLIKTYIPLGGAVSDEALTGSERDSVPLISCIMPTRNRKEYVLQSIRYFQRQDYSSRELIIVDDSKESIAHDLPNDHRIRYFHIASGLSIGAKRNQACALAQGEIIAQWDDDDWYSSTRLSEQAAPIMDGSSEISALNETVFFDLSRWKFWTCTPSLHKRMFVQDVHGGTLVYLKRVWEKLARYPDESLAEDAAFLMMAMKKGARLKRIENKGTFIYLRHETNAWSFACGSFGDRNGWQNISEPDLSESDRAFYAANSPAMRYSRGVTSRTISSRPLVSCIMPTDGRRQFVSKAIQYFLRQDYSDRELIVVDDGDRPVDDLIPPDDSIKYVRLDRKRTIGSKRNIACENASGELIVHWDDDDWMAPWRIRFQVESMLSEKADICGVNNPLFYDLENGQAWQYVYPENEKPWVYGATFCYTKSLWERQRFLDISSGEDTRFVWNGRPKKVHALQSRGMFVGLIHATNADGNKKPNSSRWHPYASENIESILRDDWSFYQGLRPLSRT